MARISANPDITSARCPIRPANSPTSQNRKAKNRTISPLGILSIVLALLVVLTVIYFTVLRNNSVFQKAMENLGFTTTASGLKYKDLVVGTGPEVKTGDTLWVNYTAWLEDGTKIISTLDSGEPYEFVWGLGQSIPGWEEGTAGMRVGGKRKLVIPPNLAFGETGASQIIGPNETLIFEVELLSIK